MMVIGIDPGLARTGYGLVRQDPGGDLIYVAAGVITTPAESPIPDRLLELYSALTEILSLHRPQSGAVEKLFFQRNVSTAMTVGQARGVALLALAEASVPVGEYTPGEIKVAVVGYGGADKRQMQDMVRVLLSMEAPPRPDDVADALAVAICHLSAAGFHRRVGEHL
jgi:crossover junction endodeoxyribonuclease RuvC